MYHLEYVGVEEGHTYSYGYYERQLRSPSPRTHICVLLL
jgi:hypothetical protein